jgi:hypothetical protein
MNQKSSLPEVPQLVSQVLTANTGRQTVQSQKWVNELIPQGDAFSNGALEQGDAPSWASNTISCVSRG